MPPVSVSLRWLLLISCYVLYAVHGASTSCPALRLPAGQATVTDTSIASSRVTIAFPLVEFDVPADASVVVNTSAGVDARAQSAAYTASGLAGRESPQGFFFRYDARLQSLASAAAVTLLSASGGKVSVSFSWTLDQLRHYDIARNEGIDLYLRPGFFGSSCSDFVYFGSVTVTSSYSADGIIAFSTITTLISLAVTGVFGWRSPTRAIDTQTIVATSFAACAEPHVQTQMGVFRLLAPFALSDDLGGMVAGNCIAIAAVWMLGWFAAIVIGKSRKAKTMEEAGSHVYFPRIPFMFMMALYQGTTFAALRLLAHGSGTSVIGGAIAGLVFVFGIPALTYFYAKRGVLGEYHGYNTDKVNKLWTLCVPTGVWLPKTVRSAAGGLVTQLHREERIFVLLVFLSPVMSSIVLAAEPSTAKGCMTQFVLFIVGQCICVVVNVWFAPWRSRLDTIYAVASHTVLSCAGAVYASSVDEGISATDVSIPLVILMAIAWLRLGNDVLVTLLDSSGIPLAQRWFFWHDGTRDSVVNAFEIKEDKPSTYDDNMNMLQDTADDQVPMPSPLAALPSMARLGPQSQLPQAMQNAPPPKRAKSPDIFDDPFGTDLSPPVKSPPSTAKKSDDPFDDDFDPFGEDSPKKVATPPPKQSKMKGIAKKLMLAAKLKAGMQEATQRREQKEMFGDDFDDDPLRKKMAQNDEVNDMLSELGGPSTRANPMADRVSAFAANQEGTGKRVAGTDLAATVMVNKQQQKAEEDQAPVCVFRVEYSTTQKRMTLVKQDESEFGSFFDGDSYVILSTKPASKNAKTLQRELFIWVGQVSTPDEIKGAVIEAATLDATFPTSYHKDVRTGGLKVTRMLQNSETTSFTGLFPGNTVKVIEGGIDEEGGKQGRLYHVHGEGARKMSLTLVPPVLESLDQGDVFVFDCGYDVYIFQGDECSPFEREHGRQYAEKLRQSRAQCVVSVVTQETAQEKFWKALGTTRKIGQAATLRRLESFLPSQINRLWSVRGPKDFKMEASGDDVCILSLKSAQLMIVDLCSVVYVWVGKSCSPYQELRDTALQRGVEYLEKHSDRKIPLIRVLENFEGDTFKDLVPEEPIDL